MSASAQAAATSALPLLAGPGERVLFQTPGAEITAETFCRGSRALGGRLAEMFAARAEGGEAGARRLVLNACQDRLLFALGFAAALLAGATSLLSAEREPEGRARLRRRYRDAILLHDAPEGHETAGMSLTLSGEFLEASSPSSVPFDRCEAIAAEPAALVFTSGSTGDPVPHPKSWPALWARSAALAPCFGFAEEAPVSVAGTVPPQHMYGFETTLLLALHAPVRVWCGPAFYPADIARALTALPAPRVLVTTPLQFRALLEAHLTLPPLFRIVSATAPLAPELAARAEETLGCEVFEIFGATEVGSIAFRRTLAGETWEMLPGLSLSVGPLGEVLAAGLGMAPTPLADVLEILDATHFRLVGRRTDIVKLAGKRASLAALNHLLTTLPGVEDGAFVLPEEEAGRAPRLIALVVAPALTDEAILEGLRARLDPVFLPRRVIRLPALPRNEFGKLPRERLLALLRETDRAA